MTFSGHWTWEGIVLFMQWVPTLLNEKWLNRAGTGETCHCCRSCRDTPPRRIESQIYIRSPLYPSVKDLYLSEFSTGFTSKVFIIFVCFFLRVYIKSLSQSIHKFVGLWKSFTDLGQLQYSLQNIQANIIMISKLPITTLIVVILVYMVLLNN